MEQFEKDAKDAIDLEARMNATIVLAGAERWRWQSPSSRQATRSWVYHRSYDVVLGSFHRSWRTSRTSRRGLQQNNSRAKCGGNVQYAAGQETS